MTQIIKYICPTQTTAFDLVNHISDAGGNVCMVNERKQPNSLRAERLRLRIKNGTILRLGRYF